jgi:hypothetical protein
MMKAISVQQPYAWLIMRGIKTVENRTWKTKIRGPVLIHASKKIDLKSYNTLKSQGVELPELGDLLTGGILGQVDITDVVTEHESEWFTGPIGFVLNNPFPLPFRAVKGQLGFFKVYL